MKNIIFLSLLLTSLSFSAQEIITLKDPDSKVLKTKFEESNYQMNIILTYLKENFKITKNRYDIKKDKQMGNTECGFTVDFEKNIKYTYNDCGEASGVRELIVFPPAKIDNLKKWVERINAAYPMDIKNIWFSGTTEYGPEKKEEGCYYTVKQSKVDSVIEIWCGS